MILQATHGVVSGNPSFFKRAFGDGVGNFEDLLLRPHHYILHRDWYEELGGKAEFDDYRSKFSRLSESEKEEVVPLLSSTDPRNFSTLAHQTKSFKLKNVLQFYRTPSHAEEALLWERQRSMTKPQEILPEDELVEDAGLDELLHSSKSQKTANNTSQLALL